MDNQQYIVIGIAGGTGSGKTTLAKKIIAAFPTESVLLLHDYYYKDNPQMTYEERAMQNYDHPNSLETDFMIRQLKDLKNGKTIMHPTYDFTRYARNPEFKKMESAKIIIVEGILIFENRELTKLIDVKIFVDTDADIRFIRRLTRDVKNRGRSMDSVVNQYISTVKPMHEQFVEPSKRVADIIVPEGGQNMVAVGMIIDGINKRIYE